MIISGQRQYALKLPRVSSIYFCLDKGVSGQKNTTTAGASIGGLAPDKKVTVTVTTVKRWITVLQHG